MDYASNLQEDAGLIPTNLQMQTTTGEKVDVKLCSEIPIEEPLVNEEDKTNEMAYVVAKKKFQWTATMKLPRNSQACHGHTR